ncbi:hypothetical protein COCSADRAFT_31072 [Bipolaris sorokiniana ND90Pr]|uniref:Uncharacterized protein n=1 Tax=Cochliobolus sativus (strain ND90Pr / ATCC 201652) TaxID=665912 RepID=M2S8K4_COCSN|nr:uncharacterized protein COCSADRAFT_31072 [Bipolaris sorokiniana ND90Pr]EMD58915.1 hypothetical protein COCSADRAFT_31072 [Bipolaris sorokiniana ND90Pr]
MSNRLVALVSPLDLNTLQFITLLVQSNWPPSTGATVQLGRQITSSGQVLYKAVVTNCAGGNMYGNINLLTDIVVGHSRGEALYRLLEHVEVQGWRRIMEADMGVDR